MLTISRFSPTWFCHAASGPDGALSPLCWCILVIALGGCVLLWWLIRRPVPPAPVAVRPRAPVIPHPFSLFKPWWR